MSKKRITQVVEQPAFVEWNLAALWPSGYDVCVFGARDESMFVRPGGIACRRARLGGSARVRPEPPSARGCFRAERADDQKVLTLRLAPR